MTDTILSLGPLVRVEGRWLLGDPGRAGGGAWVEFGEDGMRAHARDSSTESIPWSRIMMGMGVTIGARLPGKAGSTVGLLGMFAGLPGPLRGRRGGYLHMTVRHPYEDRLVFFDRHPWWYPIGELAFLQALLSHLVDEGELHRLADTAWLDRTITRVLPVNSTTTRARLQEMASEATGAGRAG
ncbi:hypothetical protein [Streptomyces sp. NBC_01276]|uniref:hypothetical protein n=1 Tax=Streptomyces sp. NBC_01276 TaxID=2903808 RepID=UPI00352F5866